jgi:glucose-6-phosphate 1-dehydrogenase
VRHLLIVIEVLVSLPHRLHVNQSVASSDSAHRRLGDERKSPEPCSIVIFGASGDLTARKLIPAFYHLFKEKQMPAEFRIIGFARREKSDESWRVELRQDLEQFSRTKPVDDQVWQEFAQHICYCEGDLTDT